MTKSVTEPLEQLLDYARKELKTDDKPLALQGLADRLGESRQRLWKWQSEGKRLSEFLRILLKLRRLLKKSPTAFVKKLEELFLD